MLFCLLVCDCRLVVVGFLSSTQIKQSYNALFVWDGSEVFLLCWFTLHLVSANFIVGFHKTFINIFYYRKPPNPNCDKVLFEVKFISYGNDM